MEKLSMKTAREMFNGLGFYRQYETVNEVCYEDDQRLIRLTFYKDLKELDYFDGLCRYGLNPKLIKAIYKQSEELGWFEDE